MIRDVQACCVMLRYHFTVEKICFQPTTVVSVVHGQHFQQSMDQAGMVANPARGQLNREN